MSRADAMSPFLATPRAKLVAAALAGAIATAAYFLLSGPSTFDECILKYMKGVGDRGAASEVYGACERMFGSPPPTRR